MSTLELENIKHPDNSGNNIELAADGSIGSLNLSGNVGIGTNTPLTAPSGTFSWANPIATIEGSRPTLYLNGSGSLATIRMWPSGTDGSSTTLDDFHINAIATSGSTPGSLVFAAQGGAIGAGLSINSNNVVTTPDQPAAVVKLNSDNSQGGQNYTVGPTGDLATNLATIKFETLVSNTGSHYSTSTGRFTCPVNGKYFVTFNSNVNMSDATSNTFPEIHKNNALYIRAYDSNDYNQGAWVQQSITAIVPCSAGDYLEIKLRCNSGFAWADSDTQYTQASFMLIG